MPNEVVQETAIPCAACRFDLGDHPEHEFEGSYYCDDCWSDVFFVCNECCKSFAREQKIVGPDGEDYCENCDCELFFSCESCGDSFSRDDSYPDPDGSGSLYCETCFDARFFRCSRCDEFASIRDQCEGPGGCWLCCGCYTEEVRECETCGEAMWRDDAYWSDSCDGYYCEDHIPSDNDDDDDDTTIHCCNYNPDFHFMGDPKNKRYFGIELEVESPSGYDKYDHASQCLELLGDDYVSIKEDGSLVNGFEIVTAPATLEIHRERFLKFFAKEVPPITSWRSGRCGIHVHISRNSMTRLTIGKLVAFINASGNEGLIRTIAGRYGVDNSGNRASQYCRISKDAKPLDKRNFNRYTSVNLENYSTVELRIFRGTLNKVHFLADVEFAHASVAFCENASIRELNTVGFTWFIQGNRKVYPELVEFMTAKSLLFPNPRKIRKEVLNVPNHSEATEQEN